MNGFLEYFNEATRGYFNGETGNMRRETVLWFPVAKRWDYFSKPDLEQSKL